MSDSLFCQIVFKFVILTRSNFREPFIYIFIDLKRITIVLCLFAVVYVLTYHKDMSFNLS